MKQGKLIYLAVLLVALFSGVAGALVWQATQAPRPAEQPALLVLPEPRAIPEFMLVDQDGAPFGPDGLQNKWSLLFFGFTHCPDVCPGTLFDLQQLHQRLSEGASADAAHQVVFVSVDPERDDPARLKEYTAYFDPDFIAVTGAHEQLEPLTRKLGIAYRIGSHEPGATDYSVDHSASVLLMNPAGRLHGVFPAPLNVADMYAALRDLID